MRLFLIFMSILTLCMALGSTMMTMIVVSDTPHTVQNSAGYAVAEKPSSLQGYVAVTVLPPDEYLPYNDSVH